MLVVLVVCLVLAPILGAANDLKTSFVEVMIAQLGVSATHSFALLAAHIHNITKQLPYAVVRFVLLFPVLLVFFCLNESAHSAEFNVIRILIRSIITYGRQLHIEFQFENLQKQTFEMATHSHNGRMHEVVSPPAASFALSKFWSRQDTSTFHKIARTQNTQSNLPASQPTTSRLSSTQSFAI